MSSDGDDGVMGFLELSAHPFALFGNSTVVVSRETSPRYIGLHLLRSRSRQKIGKDGVPEVLQLLVSLTDRSGSH